MFGVGKVEKEDFTQKGLHVVIAWLYDMQTTAIGGVIPSLRDFACTCAGGSVH